MAEGAGQAGEAVRSGAYAAFISYSHADEEFGDWLHKKLESYQVPSVLVGREGPRGPIKKRLGKIFRDRADLSAAHDLGAEIREGLEQSDALIVLCSPRSCGSKYVNEEIRTFKALGKGRRIFAAIVDGEPHAAGNPNYTAADECFPPALIYRLETHGGVSSQPEPTEPIAADFRDGKDGRENGSLKLIAGLLDVGLDELVQRERQAERARRRRANLVAAAMAILALGAFAGGGFAWLKQNEAIANFNLAERRAEAERVARAQAEQNAREREEQRQLANHNAEQARIQELAAVANAQEATAQRDAARNSLARIFAERSWQAIARGDYPLAARYALAGWRAAPANEGEYRSALSRLLHHANESRTLIGHDGPVRAVAFNRAGDRIVTASDDHTARVWDVRTGDEIAVLRGHHGAVTSVALSPSGDRVVTGSADRFIGLWDARTGRLLAEMRGHSSEPAVSFSPDGSRILSASGDNTARTWDASDGREISVLEHQEGLLGAAFSRDGRRLVTVTPSAALVWTPAAGNEGDWAVVATLRGHEDEITSASISPDGRFVVTASIDGTARIWEAATGRELLVLRGHEGWVTSAKYSPTGAQIVTASTQDHTARVWNAADGREITVLRGHQDRVISAEFSPDSASIVTASADHTARVWDAATGREVALLGGHENGVEAASFEPAGAAVATASADGSVRLWTRGRGREQFTLRSHERFAAFSPDSTRILTLMDGRARTSDAVDGRELLVLCAAQMRSAAFSRDGARVIVFDDGGAKICDAVDGRELAVFSGSRQSVLSEDGSRFVYEAANGEVRAADVGGGNEVRTLQGLPAGSIVAVSQDGERVATASSDRVARIWDARTGRVTREIQIEGLVSGMQFSPDGSRLLTTSADDEEATIYRIWDTLSGRAIAEMRGPGGFGIRSVTFSPDGRHVATASTFGNLVQVWSALTGQQLATLRGHANGVSSVEFTADGARVISASSDSVRIWDAVSGRELAAFGEEAAWLSPDSAQMIARSGDAFRSWDIRRLTEPMTQLARTACGRFLAPDRHSFSALEIGADPLIREVWLRDGNAQRDVCEGV